MRRTKAEAAQTRCSILASAERLFFEKGVSNSTLEEIATAAGVTRGAIYWHFASKSDLFLELYNSAQMPRVDMTDIDDPVGEGEDPLARIEKMSFDWLDLLAADRHLQRLLSILLRTNFTEEFQPVRLAMEVLDREHTLHLEATLARAARHGALADIWTPRSAGRTFKWMMKGLCWDWLLLGQQFDLVTEGRDKVRRLLSSFHAHPERSLPSSTP